MLQALHYSFWDEWLNAQKVTFDGARRLILVNAGVTELDVQNDLYSNWKEWWLQDDHGAFLQAFSAVGGQPLPGGRALGATYFLENGWRVRTWEGDHRLTVTGNLYTIEGTPPFVPTLNPHTITIESTVSNLVDRINVTQPDIDVLIDQAAITLARTSPDLIFVGGKPYVKISDPDLYA